MLTLESCKAEEEEEEEREKARVKEREAEENGVGTVAMDTSWELGVCILMCTCVVTMSTGLWRMCLSHISLFLGITVGRTSHFITTVMCTFMLVH